MLTLIKTRKCSIKYQCVLNKRKFAIVLIPWTLFICTWGKCYLLMNCVYFIKKCYTQNNSAFLFFLISSNFMIRYGINNIFHQFHFVRLCKFLLRPKHVVYLIPVWSWFLKRDLGPTIWSTWFLRWLKCA